MSNRSHFFEGLLIGAAIGGALGILFAPAPGSDTRGRLKKIKSNGEPIIRETKEKTEHLVNRTLEAIETGIDRLGKSLDERRKHRRMPKLQDDEVAA